MNWDFDSILEQSLAQIAAGKARVESCLLAYPTLAEELEPMLLAAQKLQEIPKPVLSPDARARIEAQVLAAAAANPLLAPPAKRRMPLALPSWRWALNALLAVVMVFFLLMTTLATVSAGALPSSALYPVKLATEDAWLWVAPARSEPALHLRFARRRLAEVEELAKQRIVDRAVLEAMADHLDAALMGLESSPPAIALALLNEAAEFIEDQQASLSSMAEVLPQAARAVIASTLDRSRSQAKRVEEMVRTLSSGEPDTPVATLEPAMPPATLEPATPLAVTLTPAPAQTAEATLTPTVGPTGTLTATPMPEPTAGTQSGTPTRQPVSPPSEPTQPPPTEPPPTQPPPTEPPPTQPPPTEPPPTQPPPEPTATKRVPPGLTKTPKPPGRTRTPEP